MNLTERHFILGSRLRFERKDHGYTLMEVQAGTGIPAAEISLLENAERKNPSLFRVAALAEFYGTTVDALIRESVSRR